jgi:hypothetical protein
LASRIVIRRRIQLDHRRTALRETTNRVGISCKYGFARPPETWDEPEQRAKKIRTARRPKIQASSGIGHGKQGRSDEYNSARQAGRRARPFVVEGCVGETFGALVGAWQARFARDPEVRVVMRPIAGDELPPDAELVRWSGLPDARSRAELVRRFAEAVA